MASKANIASRIKLYLDSQGISVESFSEDSQFGERYVLSKSTIGKATDGEGNITTRAVEKFLLRFPNVNPYWLILGRGSIENEKQPVYNEPMKTMPLDTWEVLKENNKQFAATKEADTKEKGQLLEAVINFSRGGVIPHKA